MKEITTHNGNTYEVIEIFDGEWAVISKNTIANATVMNAVHVSKKTGAQITIIKKQVLINEDVELMTPEKYQMWNRAVENYKSMIKNRGSDKAD